MRTQVDRIVDRSLFVFIFFMMFPLNPVVPFLIFKPPLLGFWVFGFYLNFYIFKIKVQRKKLNSKGYPKKLTRVSFLFYTFC